MNGSEILNDLKNCDNPVIIFGAGVVGKILLSLCENAGIDVLCFCDNSEKVSQSDFCGKSVIYFPNIKQFYPDAVFLLSVAAISDVVERLTENGYTIWYPGGVVLRDLYVPSHVLDSMHNVIDHSIDTCIECHQEFIQPDHLFLRSVDLIITERCSLRCNDCANLMQYYEKPKDVNIDTIVKSIDAFLLIFDGVIEFRLLGGEAFLNKNWPLIVDKLIYENKVKRIVIYTNGTLIPNRQGLHSLQNDKVLVVITDYGEISRKIADISSLFDTNNVAYRIIMANEWLDCSAIIPHNRSYQENLIIFKECCAKNIATLSDGKLYRCPYAANANRLLAVPNFISDSIDLMPILNDTGKFNDIRHQVQSYLCDIDFLQTCDFCNGRPLSGKEVKPAVQIVKAKPYKKYI